MISNAVNSYINEVGLVNPGGGAGPYFQAAGGGGQNYQLAAAAGAGAGTHHFQMMMDANGSIVFAGTRAFWANFVIEVPEPKYQRIFFGKAKQYISLHPTTGEINVNPYTELANGTLSTNRL